jgi:membrane protease YdiL (CAAX protease family)
MTSSRLIAEPSRRADIAALAFAALFPSAATWLYLVVLAAHPSAAVQIVYGAEKVLQFAFPLVWVVLVRRQKIRFALTPCAAPGQVAQGSTTLTPCPSPGTVRSMVGRGEFGGVKAGLALGVAVLAGMLLLYFFWLKPARYLADAATLIAAKAAALGMGSPARFIAGAVLLSSLHSLLEEYYWRWFLFGGLRRYMPVAAAIVVSSLAFAAHHVILLASFFGGLALPVVLFSICVAVGGAAWAWIYHRSGSLLGPWLSHTLIDAGIFVVGYDLIWRQHV